METVSQSVVGILISLLLGGCVSRLPVVGEATPKDEAAQRQMSWVSQERHLIDTLDDALA